MVSLGAESTDAQRAGAEPRLERDRSSVADDRVAIGHAASLAESACAFAARCHARQRRASDGGSFIEHPLEVARLLRDAGCSESVVAAGLLHDVVEDADVSVPDLTSHFGAIVANLVQAVTEDASIHSYRRRKHVLREQVRKAGGDAALVFAADKIAKVRELTELVGRDRARSGGTADGARPCNQLDDEHQLRLEHYRESLGMLQRVAPLHPLVKRLGKELADCPITLRETAVEGRT